jgi:hypothetical protein
MAAGKVDYIDYTGEVPVGTGSSQFTSGLARQMLLATRRRKATCHVPQPCVATVPGQIPNEGLRIMPFKYGLPVSCSGHG